MVSDIFFFRVYLPENNVSICMILQVLLKLHMLRQEETICEECLVSLGETALSKGILQNVPKILEKSPG